jgi:hypothetical protein
MADPEDILAGIVFTVTGLAIPSAVAAHHFFGIDVMAFANLGVSRHVFGWSFAAMAVAVTGSGSSFQHLTQRKHLGHCSV